MNVTEVVAALIWNEDHSRFLVCQRPEGKNLALKWEFVGGKIEPGETPQQALVRECREELAITVAVGDVFMDLVHIYPHIHVHLTLFHASIAQGPIQLLEHNDMRWVTVDEAESYEFCPADVDIIERLKEVYA